MAKSQLELVSQLSAVNNELDVLTSLLIEETGADDAPSQLEIISSIAEIKSTLLQLVKDSL